MIPARAWTSSWGRTVFAFEILLQFKQVLGDNSSSIGGLEHAGADASGIGANKLTL
tara:strand:- start:165 stop:332 length:168 start_codon:yes stop_codon:yes gene_type:complete